MARTTTSIKVEGGLLPTDFLRNLGKGDESRVPGLTAASYHLEGGRLHDEISASWNTMRSRWSAFVAAIEKLPESESATTATRERFLLPLFAELQYGRLVPEKVRVVDGIEYPISHFWANSPIHLLGARVPLDRKTAGVAGASRMSPHGLVQDYLNRNHESLWGFVSNGRVLRLLRDNKSLARPSFIEFDLTAMFEGEAYSDFVILWLLCHQSRVESEDPYKCYLEQWVRVAQDLGTRALEKLRFGVAQALGELGQGFLEEPGNKALRDSLVSEKLSLVEYYKQVIRVVYRIMFLFAGEDRDVLFPLDGDPSAKETYLKFYSATRLRDLSLKVFGTRHVDLWQGLKWVFSKLSVDGCSELALPALNSFLWDPQSTAALNDATLSNARLLSAIRSLAYISDGSTRQRVDYRNIGAEEIGGIYENIIALSPVVDLEQFTFSLGEGAFSERDETASHYTPTSLVEELLKSALDPVLDRACREADPAKAILSLKVCDRACGSGHFLVAAAKRMAKRLASIRTGEPEPSPEHIQKALRDVIAHCIYGVDLNPTAVELCKFSLWLESMDHGRPLSFLENRVKAGNSLFGATPAVIAAGIPDEAFAVLKGDDKAVSASLKRQNRTERSDIERGQVSLFGAEVIWLAWVEVRDGVERIISIDDDDIEHIHQKQAEYEKLIVSPSYRNQKLIADAWCAAFVLPRVKGAPAITTATFSEIQANPGECPGALREEIERLANEYGFFHWHLEFPEVYSIPQDNEPAENSFCGWDGGFDINLGNPPWDRLKVQEKEWFAERVPEIAAAPNASRRKALIDELEASHPALFKQFHQTLRRADGESHFLRSSGLYPLCGRGDVNLYTVFTEANRNHLNSLGIMGLVIPAGIATGDTTKFFFQDLVKTNSLISLYSFFEIREFFVGTDSREPFCLLTTGSPTCALAPKADLVFLAHEVNDLADDDRHFTMEYEDYALLNPNTLTCPTFRSRRDSELTRSIYRRVPVLWNDLTSKKDRWEFQFSRMFDMAQDSGLFRTPQQLLSEVTEDEIEENFTPLYEGKMFHIFDHRFGFYQGGKVKETPLDTKLLPSTRIIPQYWVRKREVASVLDQKWNQSWLLGFRDITNSGSERTVIPCIIPRTAVAHTSPLIFLTEPDATSAAMLCATLASFALDFCCRQKISGNHLTYTYLKQLPVLPPSTFSMHEAFCEADTSLKEWILPRVLELTYTSFDMAGFAVDCGYSGPPFAWDEERRFLIRCELDAAFFHLYLGSRSEWETMSKDLTNLFPTPRSAVAHIMDSFRLVKQADEGICGEYRTKETILEIYDAMAEAIEGARPYKSVINPAPASRESAFSENTRVA